MLEVHEKYLCQNLLLAAFRVPQGPVQPPSAAAAVCAGFGVPQPVQNLLLAAFRVPQGPFQPPSAACCGFGVPQPTQNLLLASFRVPQGPVQPPSAAAAVVCTRLRGGETLGGSPP